VKKGQVIKTPHGEAKVIRFLIMKGFTSGVEFRVNSTGELMKEVRFVVDCWQSQTHEVLQ